VEGQRKQAVDFERVRDVVTANTLIRIQFVWVNEIPGAVRVEAAQITAVIDASGPGIRDGCLEVLRESLVGAHQHGVVPGPSFRREVREAAQAVVQVRI
jgi:hypothetical protein